MTIATTETLRQKLVHLLADAALAGIIFWAPDVLVHALRARRFSGTDMMLLTILLPLCSAFCLVWIWKKGLAFKNRFRRMVLPVFGIWFFGPWMMMISWTLAGGGFANPGTWKGMGMMTIAFPIFTFIGSTYDGTLGALLLATVCLPAFGSFIAPDHAADTTAR